MSVAAGREFLAIPGLTVIPDAVLAAMHRPAVDIYSGPMVSITDSLLADLQKMFRTKGGTYIYAANGHGVWETALTNVLSRGDKVLVLESGRFAIHWGEQAKMLGCEVEVLERVKQTGLPRPCRLEFEAMRRGRAPDSQSLLWLRQEERT